MRKLYAFIFLTLPAYAFAEGIITNPLAGKANKIEDIPGMLISILIQVAIPVTAVFIIITGFNFATAKGDPAKIKKAKDMLTYIIIGLGILLAAKGIQMAIQSTVDSLK